MIKYEIRKNTYYDSVTLMLISKEIKGMEGVNEVLVGMATELNKELIGNLNLSSDKITELSANDFFIATDVEKGEIINDVIKKVDELLTEKKSKSSKDYKPASMDSALKYQANSNMVIISVPGKYAAGEVEKALNLDLNVMLFSDNVSIEDEKRLKELACKKELLMMGPDCGTAIINNIPLAFANVVKKGDIGIVGASGTGTQEVSSLIDKFGKGVSQVIGTGGRDLKAEIGGLMMKQGIKALIEDDDTKVIVLISKPPNPKVAKEVLDLVKETDKPFVVDFIGGDLETIKSSGAYGAITLEDCALKAVALSSGNEVVDFTGFTMSNEDVEKIVKSESSKFDNEQMYFRALYTGGTLADEAMKIMGKDIKNIYSNIPLSEEYALKDINHSIENTCIDLGEDIFTVGRPHPMIDPSTRSDRLVKEINDDVALLLMDIVLGYGSHIDPAGEMVKPILEAKEKMAKKGKYLSVVCSICGTDGDPQSLKKSKEVLEEAGVIVMPSNSQAVRLSLKILNNIK
ncbi:acyl-CoA synthetase FdrA [Helicovermis profundi]|uniref:Acyl-CoA synthetase FdrA n=1 Tax=Helicovermis profundi TaxID=3065157 RepID=A0AAU9EAF2_9FIRM|nr:acyl-CoA synthetase FdrA [Clostridia bacterium S502]